MSWLGYYANHPGEEDNSWDSAPSDEVIKAISKDIEERRESA